MTSEQLGYVIAPLFLSLILILILFKIKRSNKRIYPIITYVLSFIFSVSIFSFFNLNLGIAVFVSVFVFLYFKQPKK